MQQAQSGLLRLDQRHLRSLARVGAVHKIHRLRHLMRVLLDAQPVVDKALLGADHPGGARVRIVRRVGVSVQLDGDGIEELQRGDLGRRRRSLVDCSVIAISLIQKKETREPSSIVLEIEGLAARILWPAVRC